MPKLLKPCRPLPEPTAALPGSAEKVLTLIERARLGLDLFDPRDARIGDEDDVPLRAADDDGDDALDLDAEELLSSAAVARLLGVSRLALRCRVRRGTFPPPDAQDGGYAYWRAAAVRARLTEPV